MDWTLEVVIVPVSDIDRSIAFYRDQVGFDLDHDTKNEQMHVVQLTPRGSGCSIVFGDLPSQNEMAPGSLKGLQLVVADATAATGRARRAGRGLQRAHGVLAGDGGTFFGFGDPDGNPAGRSTTSFRRFCGSRTTPTSAIERGTGIAGRSRSPATARWIARRRTRRSWRPHSPQGSRRWRITTPREPWGSAGCR